VAIAPISGRWPAGEILYGWLAAGLSVAARKVMKACCGLAATK